MEDDINILNVHGEVRTLEKMRDKSLSEAYANPEEISILIQVFSPVEKLLLKFDENLLRIIGDAINMAKEKPGVLVKAIQVVEREQILDDKVRKQFLKRKMDPEDPEHRDQVFYHTYYS